MAVDRAAACAETPDPGGDRRSQRRLQSQPDNRPRVRRPDHRGLRSRRAAVDFHRRQSGGDRGAHLVERACEAGDVAARRAAQQRAAHRPAPRRQQPAALGHPGAGDRDLSVLRRLLGPPASDRPADRPGRGTLRSPAQRDQRRSDPRIARSRKVAPQVRRRPADRRGNHPDRDRARAVRLCRRDCHRPRRRPAGRRRVGRHPDLPLHLGPERFARLGARPGPGGVPEP